MKRVFILVLFFISIKCEAQWFKLNASQIKIDSLSIIPTSNDELQVDSNWVKLFSSGGSGEVNTASNLGGGLANFDSKSGVDLRFNSFKALDFDLNANLFSLDYINGQAASSLQNGFLSASNWSTFNSKQNAITTGTTLQYFRGDLSLATFPTALSSFTNDVPFATASNAMAFTNKAGNISMWTNDAGYLTSTGITPAALTKTDDANVTITLGGTPSTALLQATSLTLGWAGQLSIARGGTGLGSLGTASQQLRVNAGATALEYFTPSSSSGTVTNITATDNTGQTWTITNPTTTPNLSLALTSAAVGLGNVENTALSTWAGSANLITFGNNSVSNSESAQMANSTIKGRVTAGTGDPQDLTPAQVESILGITRKVKATLQTDAIGTFVDITDLNFSVAASTTYTFTAYGRMGSTATNGGTFTVTCPAGATIEFQIIGMTSAVTNQTGVAISASGSSTVNLATAISTGFPWWITGSVIVGGTAGTVNIQMRTLNAANTFTVYAGSVIIGERVNQ